MFIALNGVCSKTLDPWFTRSSTGWIKNNLLHDYPRSRLVIINLKLGSLSTWTSILNAGEYFCYELKGLKISKSVS